MKMQWLLAVALSGACTVHHPPKEPACRGVAVAAGPCALAACDSETGNWQIFPVEVGAPCGSIGHCDGQGLCVQP